MLEIGALLGADRVRRPLERETGIAQTIVEPASLDEISELVRKCESDGFTLAPLGSGATLTELRRRPVDLGISLKRLSRVIAYEPEDMTIVATAGLTLGEVNRLCGERRQRLGIDPPNPASHTLGAVIGAAHSGPLRLSEGLVRDLLIGIQFIGNAGRVVRAGGRVVKNVAGYDLMKLMTGSFGTLGIVTEATFKIRPMPERYAIATASFPTIESAFGAAARVHDALPLTHMEVLSPGYAKLVGYQPNYLMLAGFSGNRDELSYQRDKIAGLLDIACDILEETGAQELYRRLRDLSSTNRSLVAQISVLPAKLAQCVASVQRFTMEALHGTGGGSNDYGIDFCAHAGVGVAQISVEHLMSAERASQLVQRWRAAAREASGHVRVTSIAPISRGEISLFDSPAEGAMKLMRRLKASFDPAGIFNPGCFVGGI